MRIEKNGRFIHINELLKEKAIARGASIEEVETLEEGIKEQENYDTPEERKRLRELLKANNVKFGGNPCVDTLRKTCELNSISYK